MIQSMSALWRHWEQQGFEPRQVVDHRPWLVIFRDPAHACWLMVLGSDCPQDLYDQAIKTYLPADSYLLDHDTVDSSDYLVWCP